MPLLPLSLNTSFFAACCMLSKKKSTEAPVLETVLRGPFVRSCFPRKPQKLKEFSLNLFNKVLMNAISKLLPNTQTTQNNLQQSAQTASSFECHFQTVSKQP